MLRPADVARLRKLALFAPMSDAAAERLLAAGLAHHFAAGSILFRQDELPEFLHIALDGRVALKVAAFGRGGLITEFYPAGEPVLLPAHLLDLPFTQLGQLLDDSRVVLLPMPAFRQLVREDIKLSTAVVEAISGLAFRLDAKVKQLKTLNGPQRLAQFILETAAGATSHAVVTLPYERRLLATQLGMAPETISRAFRYLRDVGVEGHGREIVVNSIDALRAFVESGLLS